MKSDLVDLEMTLHLETEKAILVSDDGDRAKAVWLPKSAVEVEVADMRKSVVRVTMPERLAIDKGLVNMDAAASNVVELRPRRSISPDRPSQQAGFWCSQPGFMRFLTEHGHAIALSERDAIDAVYQLCGVSSRRELTPGSEAAARWHELKAEFDLWSRDL